MKKLRRNVVILLSTTMMLVVFMPRAGIAVNLGNAKPNTSKVLVDGVFKKFEAYTIESNNYFKLRDIVMVLNGTR